MNKFTIKLPLFIITTVFMCIYSSENTIIIIALSVLILSSLATSFRAFYYQLSYFVISVIIMILSPLFIFYIPIFSYDLISKKNAPVIGISYTFILFVSLLPLYFKWTIISITGLSCLTLFTYLKYHELSLKYVELEDYTNEMQDKLLKQNKTIIESQDNDIYVATLNERGRIAREIHDNVGHILSSSIIQIGALKAINKDEKLKIILLNLDSSLKSGMDSIRHSIHNIHAQSFDLESELTKITEKYPFCPVQLNYQLDETEPLKVKYAFVAIIKETLSNTAKHSDATMIKINIRALENYYQMIIFDNGSQITQASTNGIGLTSISERCENLNGFCHFSTVNGFKIHISIPKELN